LAYIAQVRTKICFAGERAGTAGADILKTANSLPILIRCNRMGEGIA
jgi:hypothetical protein